jgi:hypothetical protein
MKQFKNSIFSSDFGPTPFNFNRTTFIPPSLAYTIPLSDGTFLGLNSLYLNTYYDTTINGQSINAIKLVRFDSAGNVLSFQQHSYKNNATDVSFLYLLNVGTYVYVYGAFNNVNNVANNGVIRLSLDGTIDNTFTLTQAPQIYQGSGWINMKVSIGGKVYLSDNFNIYLLNNDGSLNNTFTTINIPGRIQDFAIDDYVLTDYLYVAANGGTTQRYTPDGTLDPTFNFPFVLFSTSFSSISVGGDGKLYCNGGSGNPNYLRFFRLNSNGTVDTSFNLTNVAWSNNASTLVRVSTNPSRNTVVFIGPFSSVNSTNTEVNNIEYNYATESVLNNTFNSSILFYALDYRLPQFYYLPANNTMVAINTYNYSDDNDSGFSVLNMTDNSVVSTFNIKTKVTRKANLSETYQTDIINDKLYLSVTTSSQVYVPKYDGESFNRIIRINLDSTIDNTFNPDNVVGKLVSSFAYIILSNSNIAYIGSPDIFRIYDSTSTNFIGIVKYSAGSNSAVAVLSNKKLFSVSTTINNQRTLISHTDNGSLDSGFASSIVENNGGVFCNISYMLTIASGKHILKGVFNRVISGTTTILNNTANTTNYVVYNSDGSIDAASTNLLISLNLSSSSGTMYETSDGKILIATTTKVYRFNSDLTLDISFDVNSVARIVLFNNKYYMNVGGTTLSKYNYDGTPDPSFTNQPLSYGSTFFISGDYIYDITSTKYNIYRLNGTIPPYPR